jgi:uncharacterized membrane protein
MIFNLKLYLVMLVAFFLVDMVWLGLVARKFYRKQIGFLMYSKPNWAAAIIFYLLFILGAVVFVVLPGLQDGSLKVTVLRALLYGLVTYATYDLTNLATLKDWPVLVTVVDLLWGMGISVIVGLVGFWAGGWLG